MTWETWVNWGILILGFFAVILGLVEVIETLRKILDRLDYLIEKGTER